MLVVSIWNINLRAFLIRFTVIFICKGRQKRQPRHVSRCCEGVLDTIQFIKILRGSRRYLLLSYRTSPFVLCWREIRIRLLPNWCRIKLEMRARAIVTNRHKYFTNGSWISTTVGELQWHAHNVSDMLTPESLCLISFDFNFSLVPSVASFLDLISMTTLTLNSCIGMPGPLHWR